MKTLEGTRTKADARTAVAVASAYAMVLHVLLMGAMAAPEAKSLDLSAPIQFCHHLSPEPRSLLIHLLGKLSWPGSPGTGTNQHFVAGWSACIEITLPADHAVDAEIDLGPFSLAARLDVSPAGDGARDGAAPCRARDET